MLQFQQGVFRVKNYFDGDTDHDIVIRLIDNLRDEINKLKEDQAQTVGQIDKVIQFVKRIELMTVDPTPTETETLLESQIDETNRIKINENNSFNSISEANEDQEDEVSRRK